MIICFSRSVAGHGVVVRADVELHPEQHLEIGVCVSMQRIGEVGAVGEAAAVVRHQRELPATDQVRVLAEQSVGAGNHLGRRRRPRPAG